MVRLQEVDHMAFLERALGSVGYCGHFSPKPDSPCLYLPHNNGPDGCAIFYRKDKFSLVRWVSRAPVICFNTQKVELASFSHL